MESSTSRQKRPPPFLAYAISLVVLWIVTRRPSRGRVSSHAYHVDRKRDEMHTTMTDMDLSPEEVADFEEAAGITTSTREGEETSTTAEDTTCTRDNERPQREDGTCDPGFESSENGCCVLPRSESPSLALELASSIGVEVAASVAMNFLPALLRMIMQRTGAHRLAPKQFAKISARAAAGRQLARGALARLQSKINAKVSATASKGVAKRIATSMAATFAKKLALTFATRMASAMAKTTSPLIIFDVFSMALDMADPEGYNTFVSNGVIDQARDAASVQLENEAKRTGREFPMIFPIDVAFSTAYETHVLPALQDTFLNGAIERLTEYEVTVLFECLIDETDIPEDIAVTIGEHVEDVVNAEPTRRDDCIWRALKEARVPKQYIARYPHMSSATRLGVSLSRDGVIWWNETHREEWYKYNDLFQRVPDMPEGYAPPPVALWSNSIRRLHPTEPGTADEPNMVTEEIQGGFAPLYLPAGHIVAYCEKERDALFMGGVTGDIPDANDGVDPKKFGVYFDDGTGELGIPSCVYTKGYCQRMGLQHTLNIPKGISDCWKDGGQDAAEMILGTTVSRGVSRALQSAVGFVCNPECKITEYCEGFACHPKRKVGEEVGITAGWKCLTGMEDWAKCAECKQGTDCDERRSTRRGLDCYERGKCYCEFGTCEYKKGVGERVGFTAGWKCLSGLEAFERCVECKGTAGSGNGACDEAYPERKGKLYCKGDKCHPKKGAGANVGWTSGWKCLSGREINGRCHDGEGSLDKGTDVAWNNGRFCKPYGRGSTRRDDGTYDTSADSGPAWTETSVPMFETVTPPTTRRVGRCANRGRPVDRDGNEIDCGVHTTKDECMSRTVGACTPTVEGAGCTSGTCGEEGCEWLTSNVCHWSETTEVVDNPEEPYAKRVGERVTRTRPATGAEEGGRCLGPCKGNAVDVGFNRGKFCCSGTEINGRCHDGEGSLPFGTDVGLGNGKYCESGMEDMGRCCECKTHAHCDALTTRSTDGHDCSNNGTCFCEHGKCEGKREVGQTVGLTAGWKCLSGLEAFAKCVECTGTAGAGNGACDAAHGKWNVVVDVKTGRRESIGRRYCEGDKCHERKGVGSNVGWTAGWKCTTGREINGRCHAGEGSLNPGTDAGPNNGKYCKPMGRVLGGAEEGGRCLGACSADQVNVGWNRGKFCCSGREVGGYCVSRPRSLDNGTKPGVGQGGWCRSGHEHMGTCVECTGSEHCAGHQYCEHQRCHNRHGYGANVGFTAGWKCESGMESGGRCVECMSDGHCPGGHFCEDNGRCAARYGEGHGCHGGRKCASGWCHHNKCARQGAAQCAWWNGNWCDSSYKHRGQHWCHHERCIKPP